VRYSGPDDFSLTLSGNIQHLDGQGYYGTPTDTNGNIVGDIEDSFLGDDNFLEIDYQSVHIDADKKFADGLRLNAKAQYSTGDTEYAYTYAYQYGGIGADGDFNIYAWSRRDERESFAGEVSLTKDFSFGGRDSSLIFGADYADSSVEGGNRFADVGDGNIADPQNIPSFPAGFLDQPFNPFPDGEFQQTGLFATGLIRPFDGMTLLLALRYDWATQESEGTERFELDSEAFTPQLGVSQEIVPGLNVYGLYGESFQPNFRTTVDGEILDPQTGETYEIGAKWEDVDGRLGATIALFRTELEDVASQDPDNRGFSIGGQSQRNQGLELALRGSPTDRLRLAFAYTYLDTEITESTFADAVGRPAWNAPEHVVHVSGRYDLSQYVNGLALGATLFYKDEVFSIPTRSFADDVYDAFTRLDAYVQYSPSPNVELQLNVNNLTDEEYVPSPNRYGAYNQFGPPLNALLTLRVKF